MSAVIYNYALNGVTPGAINPEYYASSPVIGAVTAFYPLLRARANAPKSLDPAFVGLDRLTIHIDWVKATAAGLFRIQLGMEGSDKFLTAFEFNAATDFNNAVDNAIGLTFNSGTYELIRFDGSSVTGGSPIVRIG